MKHNVQIVLILLALFLCAQVIGLFVTNKYLVKNLPFNLERPQLNEKTSFIQIFIIIIIATALAFVLTRLKAFVLWKIWFFLGVCFTLLISFTVIFGEKIALVIAIILAALKIFKPNVIIHNFTELFIYGGLAAVFVPIMNLFSISILLILISIYDAIAVWKTKHMVKLAKFQTKLKLFIGFLIPYDKKSKAVLGGGDIGFPLLFAGVILKNFGFIKALIIPVCVSMSLLFLLMIGKKDRFYPAMPFLSVGCFLGYGVILLINLIPSL
ncbi:hypothetical protein CL621_03770 [archaeon]|nr:hypothetical protein [archaeon]